MREAARTVGGDGLVYICVWRTAMRMLHSRIPCFPLFSEKHSCFWVFSIGTRGGLACIIAREHGRRANSAGVIISSLRPCQPFTSFIGSPLCQSLEAPTYPRRLSFVRLGCTVRYPGVGSTRTAKGSHSVLDCLPTLNFHNTQHLDTHGGQSEGDPALLEYGRPRGIHTPRLRKASVEDICQGHSICDESQSQ